MKTETLYQVPVEKVRTIKRTVYERPKMGCECIFIKLTPKIGIKIFPALWNANYSYRGQKKAAKHHLAPKVLSNVRKYLINLNYYDRGDVFEDGQKYGYFYKTEVADKPGRVGCIEEDNLTQGLESLGLSGNDLHSANEGRIKGKLVCIDFGKMST
jgi:hypothetical protein